MGDGAPDLPSIWCRPPSLFESSIPLDHDVFISYSALWKEGDVICPILSLNKTPRRFSSNSTPPRRTQRYKSTVLTRQSSACQRPCFDQLHRQTRSRGSPMRNFAESVSVWTGEFSFEESPSLYSNQHERRNCSESWNPKFERQAQISIRLENCVYVLTRTQNLGHTRIGRQCGRNCIYLWLASSKPKMESANTTSSWNRKFAPQCRIPSKEMTTRIIEEGSNSRRLEQKYEHEYEPKWISFMVSLIDWNRGSRRFPDQRSSLKSGETDWNHIKISCAPLKNHAIVVGENCNVRSDFDDFIQHRLNPSKSFYVDSQERSHLGQCHHLSYTCRSCDGSLW
jgi:hypothetical protein